MSVLLAVKGTIAHGRLSEFAARAPEFIQYRRAHDMVVPKVFYGVSGPMNTVPMLLGYENLGALETEMKAERHDNQYGQIASKMPYVPGSIVYEICQEAEDAV